MLLLQYTTHHQKVYKPYLVYYCMVKNTPNKKINTNEITKNISYSDTDNKHLSMIVFEDGTTNQYIHDVKTIVIGEWENLNDRTEVKVITITHDNGIKTEFNLFRSTK